MQQVYYSSMLHVFRENEIFFQLFTVSQVPNLDSKIELIDINMYLYQ